MPIKKQNNGLPQQGQQQRSQQRPPQQRPQQQPPATNNINGNNTTLQQKKPKKAVTKGSAFGIAFIVSFVLLLIFSGALILFSTLQSISEQNNYQQMLSDAENAVMESSINVAFTPAESIREKALASSVNLTVIRKANANTTIAEGDTVEKNEKADTNKSTEKTTKESTKTSEKKSTKQQSTEQSADDENETSYGSGVIVSQQGDTYYILTNNHVVQNAEKITATIAENDYEAKLTGYDYATDLAVLSITAKDLQVASFGTSSALKVGDYTMAIGNPYGLNDSMTSGIVSGLGRDMTYTSGSVNIMYANMIQTDTPINPGNSGGGLYNAIGELIGINTLVTADDSHADKIGYAIPIDFAIPIATNLMAGEEAAHASFGISIQNVDDDQVDTYGLENHDGAYIVNITPSGPAEAAGIVAGDIIIEYDGRHIHDAQELLYKIRASVINEQKTIKILREGKEMTLNIKVGSDV